MHEQRLIVRLQNYWDLIKKEREMPTIEQFNPGALSDIWPQCLQLALDMSSPTAIRYKYEYLGQPMIEMFREDMTGRTVDMRMKEFPGMRIVKNIQIVMQTHQPQKDENQFSNADGRMVKYRCCFLPFGDDKRGITHIIVGMSHRIF